MGLVARIVAGKIPTANVIQFIEDATDLWHDHIHSRVELHEFLELSFEEYKMYVEDEEAFLKHLEKLKEEKHMDNVVHMHLYQFQSRYRIGEQVSCQLDEKEIVTIIGLEVHMDANCQALVEYRVRDRFAWEYTLNEKYLEPIKKEDKIDE